MTVRTMPDLGDDRFYATTDPTALWRELVDADAVVWTETGPGHNGFWSVFSHRACAEVLAGDAPFTSEYGMFIGFDRQNPDSGGGRMIVVSEGDWHGRLRGAINSHLTRAMSGPLAAVVEAELRDFVGRARAEDVTDVAAHFASSLPNTVVCEVLGVPDEDRERLRSLTGYAVGAPDDPARMSPSTAHLEIMVYFSELIRDRLRRPRADLVSHLLHDAGLAPDDVLVNCDNIFAAGNATTQFSVAGAFHALATAPQALELVRGDQKAVRLAVEEVLRWTTPGPHVLRVAVGDVEINGQRIARDSPVVTWLAAANRDPRVFPDPDRFDVRRHPNRHLSFGFGPHYCVGAALARMELRMLMEVLGTEVRRVRLAGEPRRLRANKVNGYRRLPVRFEWR
ncbi:cytochrome P450 [Nonomuraea sp. NPDC004186]